MANIEKIRFCSNLMQEPHAFEKLGPVAGGIARDLTIWAAWNGASWAILNLPEFCREFGYKPQHLLKPISKQQEQTLLDEGFLEEDVLRYEGKRGGGPLSTYVGYTLALMAIRNLNFAHKEIAVNASGQLQTSRRYQLLQLVKDIAINTSSRGTVVSFKVCLEMLENCKTWYQTFDLNEYKALVTPSGQKDDAARRMYLRLVWKRKYWDKAKKVQGVNPSEDSYVMLKKVAGLDHKLEKRNASELRKLLDRIGKVPSVSMSATVSLCPVQQKYQVRWKRTNLVKA